MDLSANEPLFWSINFFLNINFLGSQFLSPPVKKSVDQDRHRNKNFPKRRKNFGHRFQHRNKTKRRKTIIRVDLKHHSEKEKKIVETGLAKKQHKSFFCSLLATAMAKKIVHKFILFVLIFSEEKKRSPGVNFASSCFWNECACA